MINQSNKGQSLVEVMVAVAVVTIALVGLTKTISYSLSNTQYARNKTLAVKYSQEALEWVRNYRDSSVSWTAFLTGTTLSSNSSVTFCINTLSWSSPGNCGASYGLNSKYNREITLTKVSGNQNEIKAAVSLTWNQGASVKTETVTTTFTNWSAKIITTPTPAPATTPSPTPVTYSLRQCNNSSTPTCRDFCISLGKTCSPSCSGGGCPGNNISAIDTDIWGNTTCHNLPNSCIDYNFSTYCVGSGSIIQCCCSN